MFRFPSATRDGRSETKRDQAGQDKKTNVESHVGFTEELFSAMLAETNVWSDTRLFLPNKSRDHKTEYNHVSRPQLPSYPWLLVW